MDKPNLKMLDIIEKEDIKSYKIKQEILDTYLKPLSKIKSVEKIINLKGDIYDKDKLLNLLYIPYFYHNYIATKPSNSTIIKLQFAYDTLLKIEGFEDIEFRNPDGSISDKWFANDKDKYHLSNRNGRANFTFKEEARRAMGIFIHNFTNFKRKYHKNILTRYFLEGHTMEQIGKNYVTRKGVKKNVSKVAIFYIVNYYRHVMIKHMKTNPSLYALENDDLTQEIWDNSKFDEDESHL